ncbi:MAG: recombinase family protein [Defluviitaleaceae bacterium]|nr:recombinase family protein [Defluviitaleaceae bacterium]
MFETLSKAAFRSKKYVIAAYLRISKEDDSRDESSSIQNQRNIIKDYVTRYEDLKEGVLVDYVDDGISGSHVERESYQRLLADIERGDVDCIAVKDLSRIGRKMLDADDLLMNYLVSKNVRFIAIGNNYDSLTHPLTNLELSLINLVNQHYNRDLAQKAKAARLIKSQRGEHLGSAPFGYKKSVAKKGKLEPDEEASGYVKLIFSLALEGRKTSEIAKILNEQGIPTPLAYRIQHDSQKKRKKWFTEAIDPDYSFWTNATVRNTIINEIYLGTVISCTKKIIEPGTRRTVKRPREEWIIVSNVHEPLISEDDFQKAQLILQKKRYPYKPEPVFYNKVRCPFCGYAMQFNTNKTTCKNPRFMCRTIKFTDHYGCSTHVVLQSEIEKVVLSSIRAYAAILINQEEINSAVLEREEVEAKGFEKKIRDENKAIQVLESSIKKLFTSLLSENITGEDFQRKKKVISDTMERKRIAIEEMEEQLKVIAAKRARADKVVAEWSPMLMLERLDRELVDLLIEKIYVHSEKEIEIVWKDMQ